MSQTTVVVTVVEAVKPFAGLRFYRYPQTVVEMERRRAERTMAARQAFRRYL